MGSRNERPETAISPVSSLRIISSSGNWGILFVLVSGFTFGLMHVFPLNEGVDLLLGLIQSISYVTMGLFLAYYYQKTNNIFSSIGLHFLNNFLSVLIMINMMWKSQLK